MSVLSRRHRLFVLGAWVALFAGCGSGGGSKPGDAGATGAAGASSGAAGMTDGGAGGSGTGGPGASGSDAGSNVRM